MNIPMVNLKEQYRILKPSIQRRINNVLEHGSYIQGPEVRQLEIQLQEFTNSKNCIAVSSGTEALLISLMALGITKGDEVITTAFTFIATIEVIVLLGATPVLVDVDSKTCNINTLLVERAISPKTKAIIPVSLYGQPADMDGINAIAKKYGNIPVIEDAAQSFGAKYKNRRSCNLSDIGCTSFFPSKPLGCYGDGGAIFTNDDNLAEIMRQIRVHGQKKRYNHVRVGVGGRIDTMQCAILLSKMEIFEDEIRKRIEIGEKYNAFMKSSGIACVDQLEETQGVFAQYTIMVESREKVIEKLKSAHIETSIHYPTSINEQPAYQSICINSETPQSHRLSKKVLSLPMGPYLTEKEQEYVMEELKRAIS